MRCYICNREADSTTDDGFPICVNCEESVDLTLADYDELIGPSLFDYLDEIDEDEDSEPL